MSAPKIGVLALQGDVAEHSSMLRTAGADAVSVRRIAELESVAGLVIPGGESTTLSKLLTIFEVLEPLRKQIRDGLPVFGSCAGMILLANEILDTRDDAESLNAIDMTVRRNAFGRQVDSFETDLEVEGLAGGPFPAVFIRAPWVENCGSQVEVLASLSGVHPVAVRQGNALATSFHPEVTNDSRLHEMFVDMVRQAR